MFFAFSKGKNFLGTGTYQGVYYVLYFNFFIHKMELEEKSKSLSSNEYLSVTLIQILWHASFAERPNTWMVSTDDLNW